MHLCHLIKSCDESRDESLDESHDDGKEKREKRKRKEKVQLKRSLSRLLIISDRFQSVWNCKLLWNPIFFETSESHNIIDLGDIY